MPINFTKARDSEWQWHRLGDMQVCLHLAPDRQPHHTPPLCFLQAGCPSCCPANSVKALKAMLYYSNEQKKSNRLPRSTELTQSTTKHGTTIRTDTCCY